MNFLILCDAVRKHVYIMLMPGYAEKPKENLSFFFLEFFCQYQLLLYYPNNTSCAHSHIIYSGFLSLSILLRVRDESQYHSIRVQCI